MHPRCLAPVLVFALLAAPAARAQDTAPAESATGSAPATVDPETLAIRRGQLDIKKMYDEHLEFRQQAVKRVLEIDEVIEPIMARTAAELFKITPEEYQFLRLQATSSNTAQALKKAQDSIDYDEALQILDYLDDAYAALQNGQFWIGTEESLIPKDAQLYQAIQTEVEKALSATEEGRKALALIVEREELLEKLNQPKPMLEYLVERRKWWDAFPEYKETLKKTKREEILQHLND